MRGVGRAKKREGAERELEGKRYRKGDDTRGGSDDNRVFTRFKY